ncbi:hypothetical protein J007_01038 [Cryptococcus neoformans]|nr:hypothetical protein J007_01038 [Cryptococcus neoformans var. grubii]OXC64205.1 hypothetical protein C358_01035 [Cryptococcus neoformans var. grubii MW-RSA852]
MPSRKKGRGRVIIVSDCILKATGFLEKKDDEGNVIERARRIICPGSQEDSWWTAQDVVKQGGRMPWPFHRYLLEDGQPKGLESVLQSRLSPKLLFGEDVEPPIEKALTIMLQNGLFVAKNLSRRYARVALSGVYNRATGSHPTSSRCNQTNLHLRRPQLTIRLLQNQLLEYV